MKGNKCLVISVGCHKHTKQRQVRESKAGGAKSRRLTAMRRWGREFDISGA